VVTVPKACRRKPAARLEGLVVRRKASATAKKNAARRSGRDPLFRGRDEDFSLAVDRKEGYQARVGGDDAPPRIFAGNSEPKKTAPGAGKGNFPRTPRRAPFLQKWARLLRRSSSGTASFTRFFEGRAPQQLPGRRAACTAGSQNKKARNQIVFRGFDPALPRDGTFMRWAATPCFTGEGASFTAGRTNSPPGPAWPHSPPAKDRKRLEPGLAAFSTARPAFEFSEAAWKAL